MLVKNILFWSFFRANKEYKLPMKSHILLPAIFFLILLSSCTIEDEVTDLTYKNDILIETTIFFTEDSESYDVSFTYFETGGYDNLVKKYSSYSGGLRGNRQVFYKTVKKYKKAGLQITPGENITEVLVNFYELGAGKENIHQFISRDNKGFTFIYDFETYSQEVIWE